MFVCLCVVCVSKWDSKGKGLYTDMCVCVCVCVCCICTRFVCNCCLCSKFFMVVHVSPDVGVCV